MKRKTCKRLNRRNHEKAIKGKMLGDDPVYGQNRNSPIEFKKCKYTYSKFPPSDSVFEAKIKNVSKRTYSKMHSSCSIPLIKIDDSDDYLEELPIKVTNSSPTKQTKMEQSKKEPFVFIRNKDIVKFHPVISHSSTSALSKNEIQEANSNSTFHKTLQDKTLSPVQSSLTLTPGICSNVQKTYTFSSLPNGMTSNHACGTSELSSFSDSLVSVPTYSNVSGTILIPSRHSSASITSSNLHGNNLTSHVPSALASINGQCANIQGSFFIPTVSYPLKTMQESSSVSGTIIMPSVVQMAPLAGASSSFKMQSGMSDSVPLAKSVSTASESGSSKVFNVEQCSIIDSSVCQSNLKCKEALSKSGNTHSILYQANKMLKNSEISLKEKQKTKSSSSKTNMIQNNKFKKSDHLFKKTQKISSFSQSNVKQKTDLKQSETLLSKTRKIKQKCPRIDTDNYNYSKRYNPVKSVPKNLSCKDGTVLSVSSVTNSDKVKLVIESLPEKTKSKTEGSKTSIEMLASDAKHHEIQHPGASNIMDAEKLVSTKRCTKQNSKLIIESSCPKANHKHQNDLKLLQTNEGKVCNEIVPNNEDTVIASEGLERSNSNYEIDRQVPEKLTSNENLFKTPTNSPGSKKVDKSCEVTPRKNDMNEFFSDYLTDPDFHFFLSLMPFVRKMNLPDRLKFRIGIQEVLQKVLTDTL